MLGHRPGKQKIAHLSLRRLTFRDNAHVFRRHMTGVFVLNQQPPRNLFKRQARRARIGQRTCRQQPQVLLLFKNTHRLIISPRRNYHFSKNPGDHPRSFCVQKLVQCNNPTKGTGAITIKCLLIGLLQRRASGGPTRIGVFDDHTGRTLFWCELTHQLKRCISVVDVVIGQLFALVLLCRCNARTRRAIGIKRRRLVRVLSIAQRLRQLASKNPAPRCPLTQSIRHPGRNSSVISPGARIGRLGKLLAERIGGCAIIGLQLPQHRAIIFHINHNIHKSMVLCRRADHGRAANIDILDHLIIARTARQCGLKRVEVHHQQIDGTDPMRLHRGAMIIIVTQGQQSTMHHRMQRFHTAIHHLRKARNIRDIPHRQTGIPQGFSRPTGAQ